MKFKLFVLLFIVSSMSQAQERYRIQYNYKTDLFTYFKLDKSNKIIDTLENPKFKRNSLIEIKLINVNPFAVKIKTDVKEEEIHATGSQGFNFSNLLGGISSAAGGDLKLNVANLPSNNKLFQQASASRGENISNAFTQLNTVAINVDALKKSMIADLSNPNLDKATILQNLRKAASIQEDARIADPNQNFHIYISSLKKIVNEDAEALAYKISDIKNEMEQMMTENKTVTRGELLGQNVSYTSMEKLIANLKESSNWTAENLTKIEELYSALEASSFEQTYDYEITADKVNLELQFVQSDFTTKNDTDESDNGAAALATLKTRHIKLLAKGGFKINTSVALTLNNFKSKSYDYFIDENGVIGSEANNYFTPNLSTMINFYPVIGENINFGGSFGVSIPISDAVNGINYLFGPSLILGSKSRIALSGGLAYGPVKKLTNGLNVGDPTVFNDVNSFTKNVYEFGFYFGISFSIFNLN